VQCVGRIYIYIFFFFFVVLYHCTLPARTFSFCVVKGTSLLFIYASPENDDRTRRNKSVSGNSHRVKKKKEGIYTRIRTERGKRWRERTTAEAEE